jgi:hypothetical protein
MTDRLKIIDNFLPIDQFQQLADVVLSEKFPWFYSQHVSLAPEDNIVKDPLAVETDGFNHVIYDKPYDVTSFTYELFMPFFKKLATLNFTEKHLIRARCSMKHPRVNYSADNYNLPHVDYFRPHETLIYYFNDCDGDTRIFDQLFVPVPGTSGIGYDKFTTRTRINPKANRLVWFNGLQYHTASNPINSSRRVILNINLESL